MRCLSAKPVVTFLGSLFLTAQLVPPANSQTQTSTIIPLQANKIIYVKQDASGDGTGTTWANAYTDLQAAIAAAAASDEIWVATGTYKPTSDSDRDESFALKNFVAIYGGFAGNETSRSQRNWNNNPTILSGDIGIQGTKTDNSYHVVKASNTSRSAVLDGFIITQGYADGPGGTAVRNIGGGIYSSNGNATLANLTISDNFAENSGGGMYNSSSEPILTNVIFSSNLASSSGGGIYNSSFSNPTIINSLFYKNSSQKGGGIYNWASSGTITNTTFSGNLSDFGAAISNNSSSPTVTNSILWDNTAAIDGSQILNENNSTTTVTYSLVQGGYGGTNNINANPLFVDAANGDLRLQAGSPAINSGDNSAIAEVTDLAGNPRIVAGTVDMGAYEGAAP